MSGHADKPPAIRPTPRGAIALLLAADLLFAGLGYGWTGLAVAGIALALATAVGLAETLLAHTLGRRAPAALTAFVPEPHERTSGWVRVNQHGTVIKNLNKAPMSERGLYRRRAIDVEWRDAWGLWLAKRSFPCDDELYIPPATSSALMRDVLARIPGRMLDAALDSEAASVRPYAKGDSLRQISWKQTAHHGELMSFENASATVPPVLLVVDTLDATDADELAASAAACLKQLRRQADVLVTDGVYVLRTPVEQERFLAALVPDGPERGSAASRATFAARLAAPRGQERRRVLFVSCAEGSPFQRALAAALPQGGLHVLAAHGVAATAEPRSSRAGDSTVGGEGEKPVRAERPSAPRRSPAFHELLATAACGGLGYLAYLAFLSLIAEGDWHEPAFWLLVAASVAGSGLGALARGLGARRWLQGLLAVTVFAATLGAGAACVANAFEERHGFGLFDEPYYEESLLEEDSESGRPVEYDEHLDDLYYFLDAENRIQVLMASGSGQLAGEAVSDPLTQTWDLVALLAIAGVAAFMGALATLGGPRPLLALAALAIAAVDQAFIGTYRPQEVMAAVALGLFLTWLSRPHERTRPARLLAVATLSAALAWAGVSLAPVSEIIPLGTGNGTTSSNSTQINGLVDLSQTLTSGSTARVLTYTTSASEPLYLRLGSLTDFDGQTWSYELDDVIGAQSVLETMSGSVPETTLYPDSTHSPLPLGTVDVEWSDQNYTAHSSYQAPVSDSEGFQDFVARSNALMGEFEGLATITTYDTEGNETTRQVTLSVDDLLSSADERGDATLALPDDLPESFQAVVASAVAAGADASDGGQEAQVAAVSWLIDYFTQSDFTYSLDAADDGSGNLEALGTFLETKTGYCTHYATAFTLLARALGVNSRVIMGFSPSDETSRDGYVVTMADLHAWSEVWIDGVGWVYVDVTPAAGETESQSATDDTPTDEVQDPTATSDPTTAQTDEPVANEPQVNDTEEPGQTDDADTTETPDDTQDAAEQETAWLLPVALAIAAAAIIAGALAAHRIHKHRLTTDPTYAWRSLCRRARRHGIRWPKSANEEQIAELIDSQLEGTNAHAAAQAACLKRYGK